MLKLFNLIRIKNLFRKLEKTKVENFTVKSVREVKLNVKVKLIKIS